MLLVLSGYVIRSLADAATIARVELTESNGDTPDMGVSARPQLTLARAQIGDFTLYPAHESAGGRGGPAAPEYNGHYPAAETASTG